MSNIYHDLILDHYRNPRYFGTLENPDVVVKETNASCGDEIEIQLGVERFTNNDLRITNLRWRGQGCAISMAGASMLSERVTTRMKDEGQGTKDGKSITIQEILGMTDQDMVEMLGGEISSGRMRCATLALIALQKAFEQSVIRKSRSV